MILFFFLSKQIPDRICVTHDRIDEEEEKKQQMFRIIIIPIDTQTTDTN